MTTPTPDEICERLRSCFVMFAGKPHFSNKTKVHKAADLADAADLIQQQQATIERLFAALEAITEHYVSLVNSGDAGSWNPEDEGVVKQARTALGKDAK